MRTSPPLPVVLSLTALIDGLFEAVAARFGIFPIRGPLVRFLWKRLSWVKLRFENLAARLAAGGSFAARPSRPGGSRPARDENAFLIRRWVNPKFGWLCRVASGSIGASAFGAALRHLLTTDPDMLALLAATPATARTLRPLCHMLGVSLPPPPVALPAAAAGAPPPRATRADDPAPPKPIVARPRAIMPPAPPPDPPVAFFPAVVFKAA